MKFIVGIDEVGRGPLAGPVAVGAVVFPKNNEKKIKNIFKDVRDSKKLTPEKRKEIAKRLFEHGKIHNIRFIVCYESNKVIDKKGITWAIKSCIKKSFNSLDVNPVTTEVFLDGGLKAPPEFIYQKTVIKGDDKVFAISLASVIAKVSRDLLMERYGKRFPKYGFGIHKGYGTKNHIKIIKKHGLSHIHRKTFIKLDL